MFSVSQQQKISAMLIGIVRFEAEYNVQKSSIMRFCTCTGACTHNTDYPKLILARDIIVATLYKCEVKSNIL